MDLQLKKGLLELLVLSILRSGDFYGYILMNEVSKFVDVSDTALYPILKRLESDGELITYSLEHNGRLRKYYQITQKGIIRLKNSKEDWIIIKKMFHKILGGDFNE